MAEALANPPLFDTVNIGGLPISKMGFDDTAEYIKDLSTNHYTSTVVTASTQTLRLLHDVEFYEACKGADLITADGKPLEWASRLAGDPVQERVTGSDLEPAILEKIKGLGGMVIYIGGTENVNYDAVQKRRRMYSDSDIHIEGLVPSFGYHEDTYETARLIDEIHRWSEKVSAGAPFVMYLCTGQPKSEIWLSKNKDKLPGGVAAAFGAAINFAAEDKKRAPKWMQQVGFEWAYRAVQDPRLWFRYSKDLPFLAKLAAKTLMSRPEKYNLQEFAPTIADMETVEIS